MLINSNDNNTFLKTIPIDGETFVEQRIRLQPWYTPYKFSGKEKDEETSYSYLGARYYDSDLSVWLSVDPMAGKYPNSSPYLYCENNPVVYVDPNGEFKRRFGAMIYKCFHGGEVVQAIAGDRKGDWYVNKTAVSSSGILYGTRKIPNSNSEVAAAYEGDASDVGSKMRYSWRDGKRAESSGESWWSNTKDNAGAVLSNIGDFIKRIDEGGHADGANTGRITKQDVVVGGGIAGALTGFGALVELGTAGAAASAYIIPSLTTANSIDDAFTNSNGESGLQQISNDNAKNSIGACKFYIGILSVSSSVKQPLQTLQSPYRTGGTILDANSVNNAYENKSN